MNNGSLLQCPVGTFSGALLVAAMYYLFRLG